MVSYITRQWYTHQCYTQSPSVSLCSTPPSRREASREEQAPHLPTLILRRKINFTCAKHKLHCEATSLVHNTNFTILSSHLGVYILRKWIYAISGGASPSPTDTDFATQNQLHLCLAQTSPFYPHTLVCIVTKHPQCWINVISSPRCESLE